MRKQNKLLWYFDIYLKFISPFTNKPPIVQKCLNVYWIDVDQTLWRPPVRESCAMTVLNRTVYMYGGLGQELFGDLMKLNPATLRWSIEPLALMSILDEPK